MEVAPDGKQDAPSVLTQALAQEMEKNKNKDQTTAETSTADPDSVSLAPSASSPKPRRRRWFGGSSKSVSEKPGSTSTVQPPLSNSPTVENVSEDSGKPSATSTSYNNSSLRNVSRPVSVSQPRRLSGLSGSTAGRGSPHGSSTVASDSLSMREKEITEAQDRLDRWGSRASGGTERAERELGLGDEVNMGLS